MTPAAVAWNERNAAIWSARAEELRALGGRLNANLAAGLEWIVRGMRADLAAIAMPRPTAAAVERAAAIEKRIASIVPRVDAGSGVTINGGPIMQQVREALQRSLAELRGEAVTTVAPALPPLPMLPPPEALPFTGGAQLDLFGSFL